VILTRLIESLVGSSNEAADDVLLEALQLGAQREKAIALDALLRRQTTHGLGGVIEQFETLPQSLQALVLSQIKLFPQALREAGKSDSPARRLAAMKLIALGRQGRLCYVLSENLHDADDQLSKAAAETLVQLARWVATETRHLQEADEEPLAARRERVQLLVENRAEIEQAVARAMDLHRGRHGQELLRAAMLLCDWPGSKTLAILGTTRHGGQGMMVRRLQQAPDAEHVEAFLLGASHAQLRTQFGNVFGHVHESATLAALLRKTHWLKDQQLAICVHLTQRGAWLEEASLARELSRRTPAEAATIGSWVLASGLHDVLQDQRLEQLHGAARDDFDARLRLLRMASERKRSASTQFFRAYLDDPDERLMRIAVREIARRRPPECDNLLLQRMSTAPASVRRVIARAVGESGFEHFWSRFDRLDRATRRQAGRAMLKLLPDANQRLARKLMAGEIAERVLALQIVHELKLAGDFREQIIPLCSHAHPKVRSKAVSVLGDTPAAAPDVLLEKVINDTDARVRANAIEVIESRGAQEFVPLLAQRARAGQNRERANAIKALSSMRVGTASSQLVNMLRDPRSEHRISALWALRQVGWWQLVQEVAAIARSDANLRVRRYALGVLRVAVDAIQANNAQTPPRPTGTEG
jgi:hypothetical protein